LTAADGGGSKIFGKRSMGSTIGSPVFLKIVDAVVGLRVAEEEETLGVDLTQHGEKAYNDQEHCI